MTVNMAIYLELLMSTNQPHNSHHRYGVLSTMTNPFNQTADVNAPIHVWTMRSKDNLRKNVQNQRGSAQNG